MRFVISDPNARVCGLRVTNLESKLFIFNSNFVSQNIRNTRSKIAENEKITNLKELTELAISISCVSAFRDNLS
jgi:hypothetical protein